MLGFWEWVPCLSWSLLWAAAVEESRFPLAPLVETLLLPSFPELWSLGVDGNCGGAPVPPPPQPVREALTRPPETLPSPHLLGTTRDVPPPESRLRCSLEGRVAATTTTASVSLSNSDLIPALW